MEKKNIEDLWTYQKIGTPFPPNVQKAPGQANKYVALWYRHGKPVMGRAWNDCGVVQCIFYVDNKVFSGNDVGGQIQLLTYDPLAKNVFKYEWVDFKKASSERIDGKFEAVRCGSNTPAYLRDEELLGNLNTDEQTAIFVDDNGKIRCIRNLNNLMVLCKIFKSEETDKSMAKTTKMPLLVNDWEDINWGSEWPADKPLVTIPDNIKSPIKQYVALWYRHGKPIMGRAWSKNGKVEASFADGNSEYTGATVGSLQLLVRLPPTTVGYEYVWKAYEQAIDYRDKDFLPVHLSYVSPVLVPADGNQLLGKVDLKTEKASVSFNGKVVHFEGGQVRSLLVLCRKEHADTMLV